MRLEPADGVLRVEVHDSGDGEVRPVGPDEAVDDESGRGLLLVAAFADTWGVGERSPGKVVWCEFAVRVRGAASGPAAVSAAGRAALCRE